MTHSTDSPCIPRWRGTVRMILRSWYGTTGAAAPGLTAHGVADTMLESLVAEVQAATAADLREELRRAQRAVENLREQHRRRSAFDRREADRAWRQDTSFQLRHEVAVAEGRAYLARALRAERQLRNQGDQ